MNNLAKYRGKHGLTQAEMAEKLKITKSGVCFFERNTISLKTAKKCAEILNENIFDILGTDSLVVLPQTEEDKQILIKMIKEL